MENVVIIYLKKTDNPTAPRDVEPNILTNDCIHDVRVKKNEVQKL